MPPTSTMFSADVANDMYWSSARTVEEIARELNVSRSSFYSAIRPIGAGSVCATCGEAMVFTNRSNRESGLSTCQSCPPGGTSATAGAEMDDRRFGSSEPGSEGEGEAWSRWRDDLAAVTPQRAAMVGGAAALGVVVGAAATRMLREMR
jgi:hypothetical protein